MSRSYKRTPVIKYSGYGKKGKKRSNKKLRQKFLEMSPKSNLYRKVYNAWNIRDFRDYGKHPKNAIPENIENWKKYYYRK